MAIPPPASAAKSAPASPIPISLIAVRRLGHKAILLFGAYVALLLAIGIAGFLGQAVGIWASFLWAAILVLCLVLYSRRRRRHV